MTNLYKQERKDSAWEATFAVAMVLVGLLGAAEAALQCSWPTVGPNVAVSVIGFLVLWVTVICHPYNPYTPR